MFSTLRMVSVPLIVSGIVSSLASLSMKTSGSIGLRALVYYLTTTLCAVVTGRSLTIEVPGLISVPGTNMLGLIVFSILIGCILSIMEEKAKPMTDLFRCMYQVVMRMIAIFICAVTLPVTMDCLVNKNTVDSRVVNFITPIGAIINMDGCALYIPMLTIFFSQRLGLTLDFGNYFIIGERFRAVVNVNGDSLGAGIVNHLSSKVLNSETDSKQETDAKDRSRSISLGETEGLV
ncbi:excitatory amino acid transporter 5-like [Mizuhopecten yessoensis]|uniref:excitatory amino acid transporter 5-like n=1 Tax=Mizuhopecten yessoensis TaxID=6573 RepID=UPI000B4579FC|nr:excitatory amino acid transporter 5-like [Mizuhopecten yessoensis]